MTDARTTLRLFLDRTLDALTAHDGARLPVSDGMRYTENGQQLPLNNGLWRTFGSVEDFRIDLADPNTGQALYHGLITENGVPGLLTLRLRMADKHITELEAIIVRAELPGASVGVTGSLSSYTMFSVRPPVEFDPANVGKPDPIWSEPDTGGNAGKNGLAALADAYFDAVEAGPERALPVPSTCKRVENAAVTTHRSGYVTRVRRRHVLVDQERGALFGVYLLDHPGTVRHDGEQTPPETYQTPSSFLTPHLFKARDGAIVRVESTVKPVPYKMPFGWD